MVSRALKLDTVNTCVLSGSVAIEFSSVVLTPDPTPTEKMVTPWPLNFEASCFVADWSLD